MGDGGGNKTLKHIFYIISASSKLPERALDRDSREREHLSQEG